MTKVSIEIYSDIVCPWCWIGKRNLEKALETYGSTKVSPNSKKKRIILDKDDVEVIWRPFMLRPNTPAGGVPKHPDKSQRVPPYLKASGERVGIDFTGLTDQEPNTLLPHALLEYALETYGSQKQNQVQEKIFQAYFTDGIFPDKNNLAIIGEACGLDKAKVKEVLDDEERLKTLYTSIRRTSKKLGGGVPLFVFNGEPVFSGAQQPATFHEVFDMILDN